MKMPGRFGNEDGNYRYGFNGAEADDEFYSQEGNSYDLGLRMYDPRIARMKSRDPRADEYPWQSPYVYHRNSPIAYIDYMGGGDEDPPTKYTVKEGDNLSEIAKAKKVSVEELSKWNNISDAKKTIYTGQELIISNPNSNETNKNGVDDNFAQDWTFDYSSATITKESSQNGTDDKSTNNQNGSLSPIGPTLILAGQKIKYLKPVGALGSSPGSSPASYTLRKAFPQKMTKRVLGTRVLGGMLGRATPIVGWAYTGIEILIMLGQSEGPETYRFETENWRGTMNSATNKKTGEIFIWNPVSDSSLKENIKPLDINVLDKILSLKVYTYSYKKDAQKEFNLLSDTQIGFLIQEVEEIFPEIIGKYDDGNKYIALHELMPLIIVGISEQNIEIKEMQEKLNNQQLMINKILEKLGEE